MTRLETVTRKLCKTCIVGSLIFVERRWLLTLKTQVEPLTAVTTSPPATVQVVTRTIVTEEGGKPRGRVTPDSYSSHLKLASAFTCLPINPAFRQALIP